MKKTEITYDEQVINDAIELYGKTAQTMMLFEEMAELQKEVCKINRGSNWVTLNLISEMADVYIMLEQLKVMYNVVDDDIQEFVDYKIERLKRIIKEYEE